MDILLIFYSILFFMILLSPFVFYNKFSKTKTEPFSEVKLKKKILLDNLRDLKAEMDTKKITFIEFESLSSSILNELLEIDKSIDKDFLECITCKKTTKNISAKFCETCGTEF